MLKIAEYNEIINNIVEEVQKLPALEQQQLLVKIKLSNYLRGNKKPIANYNKKKFKEPTLEQIDEWKHESRRKK